MFPINAKLNFHAFLGPEGHLFKQYDFSFQANFCKTRFQKEKKVKLGLFAEGVLGAKLLLGQ